MRLLLLQIFCISSLSAQVCDPNLYSLRFDGTTHVEFPANSDLDIKDKITVEAWIKVQAWAPNVVQGSIVCKHGWTSGEKGYVLRAGGNGELSFAVAGEDNGGNPVGWKEVVSSAGDLQLNTWHHVAGTYDGHKLKLFIDGVQVDSKNFNGHICSSSAYDLKIGRIADNNTADKRYFTGLIDDVRIWKIARSKNDIESDMNDHISSSSDLIAYWKFNDGPGQQLEDDGNALCNSSFISAVSDADVPFTNGIVRPEITSIGNSLFSSALLGNQWNHNGVPISGATGISYTPVTGGDYTVTADYGLGCIATSEVYVVVISSVSELSEAPFTIQTYRGGFGLQLDRYAGNRSWVSVCDLRGSEIFRSNNVTERINTGSPGIYILNVSIDDRQWRGKVVVIE